MKSSLLFRMCTKLLYVYSSHLLEATRCTQTSIPTNICRIILVLLMSLKSGHTISPLTSREEKLCNHYGKGRVFFKLLPDGWLSGRTFVEHADDFYEFQVQSLGDHIIIIHRSIINVLFIYF